MIMFFFITRCACATHAISANSTSSKRITGKKKDFYDYQNYLQGVAEMFGTYIIRVKDDYSSQKISPFAANDSLRPLGSR